MNSNKMHHVASLDVIWWSPSPPDITESRFSYEFCRKTTRRLCESHTDLLSWNEPDSPERLVACFESQHLEGEFLLFVFNPELVIATESLKRMIEAINGSKQGPSLSLPVYNETPVPCQTAALPEIYLNLTTYIEVADLMPHCSSVRIQRKGEPLDLSCFLIQKSHAPALKSEIIASKRVQEGLAGFANRLIAQNLGVIVPSALVHRFGSYATGARENLAALVPESTQNLLDLGCGQGGFGKLMKSRRPDMVLTGIEMNPAMAAQASQHYNMIYSDKIENVEFKKTFDHINCGDIIEHLYDPWTMLKKFYTLLNENGSLVISLPNAGHWTIVKDLTAGRFQYISFGLLCITHIRWFTEESIREALTDAMFEIETFDREQVPPTPVGRAFIDTLCDNGMGDRISLLTNQFNIRAFKK